MTLPARVLKGAGEHTPLSHPVCTHHRRSGTPVCVDALVFRAHRCRGGIHTCSVCACDHKQAAFMSLGSTTRTYMSPCARVCTCVCTSRVYTRRGPTGSSIRTGVGTRLRVHAAAEAPRRGSCLRPEQALPLPPGCPRPSAQRTRPRGPGGTGAVLTRDCRMAWLVAFMQESSGKEHSPSQ